MATSEAGKPKLQKCIDCKQRRCPLWEDLAKPSFETLDSTVRIRRTRFEKCPALAGATESYNTDRNFLYAASVGLARVDYRQKIIQHEGVIKPSVDDIVIDYDYHGTGGEASSATDIQSRKGRYIGTSFGLIRDEMQRRHDEAERRKQLLSANQNTLRTIGVGNGAIDGSSEEDL